MSSLLACVDGDKDLDEMPRLCHCWFAVLCCLGSLFGLGAWLVSSEQGDGDAAFMSFWIVGALLVVGYGLYASRFDDDDDHGCGFGNYDEGPGNCGCMTSTCAAASLYIAGVVISASAF